MRKQVADTHKWRENFNGEENVEGLDPGSEKIGSPGVNKIALPNLNNALMGERLEAVTRLLETAK